MSALAPGAGDDAGRRSAWLFPCGAAIAFLGSVVGIGGGLFATPILHFGMGLPLRRAIATSLTLILATASAATVTEILRTDSSIRPGLVVALVVSSLVGTQVGFMVSRHIDPRLLRAIFVVVLVIAGLRVIFTGTPVGESGAPAEPPPIGTLGYLLALGTGLAAGVLAPLLGVGGGILVVPALFLGIPGLGYLGARSCSLAMAAFTSGRSTWMYLREGAIVRGAAVWLAGGALVGGWLGVHAVHQPGWAANARIAMGAVLFAVALRFAWDLRRSAPASD